MADRQTEEDAARQHNVDRTVAFAALHRLSKLAEAENAEEKIRLLWAKRLAAVFAAIVALTLAVALVYPGALRTLFRIVAGIAR